MPVLVDVRDEEFVGGHIEVSCGVCVRGTGGGGDVRRVGGGCDVRRVGGCVLWDNGCAAQ